MAKEIKHDHDVNTLLSQVNTLTAEMSRLVCLDVYLQRLIAVEEAVQVLESQPESNNESIRALESLSDVQKECSISHASIANRASHLIEHYRSTYAKGCLERLKAAIVGCKWPRPVDADRWEDDDVLEFVRSASQLVRLKRSFGEEGREALIKLLMSQIKIRFAYNFDTETENGQEANPEWFLNYLQKVAAEHAELFTDYLQPLLPHDNNERQLFDIFVDELVQIGRFKLLKLKQTIADDPVMLAFTINGIVKFYSTLRDKFGYEDEGESCLAIFTGDENVMSFWICSEYEALEKSFSQIPNQPFDTLIAETIDLFNGITQIYANINDQMVRARFFYSIQVKLLEMLYQRMEYTIPVFHSMPEDLSLSVHSANALDSLLDAIKMDWIPSLIFLELSQTEECRMLIRYDPAPLHGHLFHKILNAFSSLQDKIITEHLVGYVMNQFLGHASIFAKAMHYGISRDGEDIPMHPGLHNGILALISSLNLIRADLKQHLSNQLDGLLINKISDYFFAKVIMKNYFHSQGVKCFSRDFDWIFDQLNKLFPNLSVSDHFEKVIDCLKIMRLPSERYKELISLLQAREYLRVPQFLKQLEVKQLSPEELFELLRLIKHQ